MPKTNEASPQPIAYESLLILLRHDGMGFLGSTPNMTMLVTITVNKRHNIPKRALGIISVTAKGYIYHFCHLGASLRRQAGKCLSRSSFVSR